MTIHNPAGRALRIGLFNVKYSPNLGDGLLSECLESELLHARPGTTTLSLDLAGRHDYAQGSRFRSAALHVLASSPAFARRRAVEMVLGRALRLRTRPYWRNVLGTLDAVVLGGGNLFGDADLNFPLKIDGAMAEVRAAGLPAAVFGVGVSDNWSGRGEALFRRALSGLPLVHASVRDEASSAIWQRRLVPAGIRPAVVGLDPGLLVARHVERQLDRPPGPPLVGLGLTHPLLLRYHADEASPGEADLTGWTADLVRRCAARGWRVVLFTNGSPEDHAYLARVGPVLAAAAPEGMVSRMPRFERPAELARFISGLDLLLAHRLHANIAAYSYGVPHLGFSWDLKLTRFFVHMGRGRFVCRAGIDAPEAVAELAAQALVQGIDAQRHGQVLAACRHDVGTLIETLQAAVATRRVRQPVEVLEGS